MPKLLEEADRRKPYWGRHKSEFLVIYAEVRDLLSRLHPLPMRNADEVLLRHTVKALEDQQMSREEIDALLPDLTKLRRGAPTTKRTDAVKALELMQLHPKYGWARVANKLCNCGNPTHDSHCAERMRLAVYELKRALRGYRV